MNWDNVELIRSAQASAKERFKDTQLATNAEIEKALQSESAKQIALPRITEVEQMIFKMRSELIDYIVAHGLVDGLIWNGVLQPVENGKIVITKEMVEIMLRNLGYFDESDLRAFLEKYLPDNHYVSDSKYVHTDNNFTNEDVTKLNGIESGAEVNKIIDVIFNDVSVLDDGTRVATITITPEDIKRWYESNPDTNAFTDAEKAKLAGISDGAEVNRVDDVLVDGRSVLADDKKAKITLEDIKKAYEKNPDTNAFTDAEKSDLATLKAWKPNAEVDISNNTAEIAEAKKSISDLGVEVNTIDGRVTTLESGYDLTKDAIIEIEEDSKEHLKRKVVIFPLDFALPTEPGLYNATMKLKLHISYRTGTSTNITIPINGLVSASGTPIHITGTLEGSKDAIYIPQLILTDGKAQGARMTVTYPSYDKNQDESVTAIECTETPVATYVKTEVGAGLVPYTGATGDLFMGEHSILTDGTIMVGPSNGPAAIINRTSFLLKDANNQVGGFLYNNDVFMLNRMLQIYMPPVTPNDVSNKQYVDNVIKDAKKYVDDSVAAISGGILTESTKSNFNVAVVKFTKDVSTTIDVRVWKISESGVKNETATKTLSYGQNEIYILTRDENPNGVSSAYSFSDKSDRLELTLFSGVKLYPVFNETKNTASSLNITGSVTGLNELDPTSYTIKFYKFA